MRVRQLIALSLCLVLLGSSAHAATPTPKPSSKPSSSKKQLKAQSDLKKQL